MACGASASGFQSTRPAWGETPAFSPSISTMRYFNPLAPRGARRACIHYRTNYVEISIHSPRVGRDSPGFLRPRPGRISIHSPRVGRDFLPCRFCSSTSKFQSTRPAWGETLCALGLQVRQQISIHSPRVGRDQADRRCGYYSSYFNPLAPRGARPALACGIRGLRKISIHSPRVGRDVISASG